MLFIHFTKESYAIKTVSYLVSPEQGTKEAGTAASLEGLINTALQHNYSPVITAHYAEREPRKTITLQLTVYLFNNRWSWVLQLLPSVILFNTFPFMFFHMIVLFFITLFHVT